MLEYFKNIWDYIKINYLAIIAISLSMISIILSFIFYYKNDASLNNEVSYIDNSQSSEISDTKSLIKVDVKGEVNNPGVYEFEEGTIVMDAINKAGGLTKNASTNDINLSKILTNEMIILVNSKVTIKSSDSKNVSTSTSNTNKTSGKVSINTGSLSELMTLSGIGEAKAKSIISYREKNGNFKSIEDIQNVTGIGVSLFAKIKENITI